MRRLLTLVPVVLALAIAGCGGDGGDDADSPLDEALGYLPEDAPLVFVASTDVEGEDYQAAADLLEKFPQGSQVVDRLKQSIEDEGSDYEDDIKPILGNELVIGFPTPEAVNQSQVVAALEAEDSGKAEDLLKMDSEEVGEKDGATIYKANDDDMHGAVKDDTLLIADSEETLEDAIEQREEDSRLTEDTFAEGFEDLPEDTLLRVYGDAEALLASTPNSEEARRIKWISGMREFGLTADIAEDGISLDFRIATEGLSEGDLPIAAGSESPGVVERANEVAVALKNPTQLINFSQDAGRAVNPEGFGEFEAAKGQIGQQLGIDVDRDLIGQFTGDTAVSVAVDGTFASRSELRDAAGFETTLEKIADEPSLIAGATDGGEIEPPRGGEDLYGLVTGDGQSFVFGVVDDVFVFGNDPAKVEEIATAEPASVEGAEGALVLQADAEAIANQVITQLFASELGGLGALATQFTGPLGEATGSVQAETDALSGRLHLSIDE